MASYIYITGKGADPGAGRPLSDPIFRPVPTLGACMPNLRKQIERGDWIFVVSGRVQSIPQYIIGGFQVAEKISALEAFSRFPDYRLHKDENGLVSGNIAVDSKGMKHPLDSHSEDGFERRAINYLVGKQAVYFDRQEEIARSRAGTLGILSELKGKPGNRPIDIIGRASQIETSKLPSLLDWIERIKSEAQ